MVTLIILKFLKRFQVPRNKINWKIEFEEYSPIEFSSAKILAKGDGLNWKDPHM